MHSKMKWFSLIVGCITQLVIGSVYVFNVFQNDLKATFNFTQKEVELQLIAIGGGFELAFLSGIFYDNFGPKWTCLVGLLSVTPSYLLLWSASQYAMYYSNKSWLTAVYFFFSGMGSVFIYMSSLNANIQNFDQKHRGKVVGLLDAVFIGSDCLLTVLYYQVFKTSNHNESFGSFMLFLAVSTCIVAVLCIFFMRVEKPIRRTSSKEGILGNDEDKENDDMICLKDSSIRIEDSEHLYYKKHIPARKLLKHANYLLLLFVFGFASAIDLVFGFHITVITKSNGLSSYEETLVILFPVFDLIFSVTAGVLYDLSGNRISREFLLVVACTCSTGCAILAMLWGNNYLVLCVTIFLCSAGSGMTWTYCPAIISEMLYLEDFGRNWGIALSLTTLIRWPIQLGFGILYDQATPSGEIFCTRGMLCVRSGLLILVAAGIISLICSIVFDVKRNIPLCCKFNFRH